METIWPGVLGGYSQILFSRSPVVGLLLVAATAVSPRLALAGLMSVLVALGLARVLNLSLELVRSGLFTYNALLVGLGGAALFEPTLASLGLVLLSVAASVFITAAFHSALGLTFNLPALTLPFLLVFYLQLAAAPALGIALTEIEPDRLAATLGLPPLVSGLLQSLGALFFVPRVDAGLLVLAALLVFSRIGTLLALMGYVLAQLLIGSLVELPHRMLPMLMGYNFMLTAVALGGVWFVPSLASFLFAAVAVLICALITVGLQPFLSWNGIPLMILPFNLTVITLLYAMRQRVQDRQPKSVDFLAGTPEENLNYYNTRLSRFGSHYFVRFQAPFRGRWVCTQGVDGEQTHRGPWRFALDFEVQGPDGKTHRERGGNVSDFLCHGLPVLAPADGTVARVVDGVPDNKVGQVNLRENWGNLVLLYHAPGLYSMVCHLASGRTKVQEGEYVRRGDVLGHCGNSGRSPAPHLHWQIQATNRVGAPTMHVELHDVVTEEQSGPVWHATLVPREGSVVRNLEPQEDLVHRLAFPYGQPATFCIGQRQEQVVPDIDLYGNLLLRGHILRAPLRSPGRIRRSARAPSTSLFYEAGATHFTVHDTLGRAPSVLHLLHAALPRVPFEGTESLRWSDHLPRRAFLPWWQRPLLDVVSPFVSGVGLEVRYRARWDGRVWIVRGESVRRHADAPLLRTEARLDEAGILELTLTVRRTTLQARRVKPDDGPRHEERSHDQL